MPISTCDGCRRVGVSPEPLNREGRRISTLGGAGRRVRLHARLTGGGGAGPQLFRHLSGSYRSPLDSVSPWATADPAWVIRGCRQAGQSMGDAGDRGSRAQRKMGPAPWAPVRAPVEPPRGRWAWRTTGPAPALGKENLHGLWKNRVDILWHHPRHAQQGPLGD